MTSTDATLAVVAALEQLGIAYMLVGSYSSNAYGVPRSTQDADFVIELGQHAAQEIANCLGPAFRLDPQMSFETVTMTTRFKIEVIGSQFYIELFLLSDDAYDQERFLRRRQWQLLDRQIYLPTPEDVIVMKLRWAALGSRGKDREDVRDVIALQGDNIDWRYVEHWTDLHGSRGILDEIRRSLPSA